MSSERLEALLWQKIDGTIDSSGEELLAEFMSEDPQANERQRTVAALSKLLDEVESIEPPPELRESLLDAIREPLPQPLPFVVPGTTSSDEARPKRVRLSYLAAGILIGVIATRLLMPVFEDREPVNASQVTATMSTDLADTSVRGLTLALEPIEGELELWQQEGRWVAELRLDEPAQVLLTLDGQGRGLELESVRQEGGRTGELTVRKHEISLEAVGGGKHRIAVRRSEHDSPYMVVRVSTRDHLILEKKVLIGGLPEISPSTPTFE